MNRYKCDLKYQDTYSNVENIYVIGDIHGDSEVLKKVLLKAQLIDTSFKWIGKDSHVVQLGDILDGKQRGNVKVDFDSVDSMEEYNIYEFLNDLDAQAREYGGRVHYLIGNHELMNVLGNFSYVLGKHMSSTGVQKRRELFSPGGKMANMLACRSYGILNINGWIFCHGGLLPQHIKHHDITWINHLVKDILKGAKSINKLKPSERDYLEGNNSFLWTRAYANNKNKCELLNTTLSMISAKGMILGHTPHDSITCACKNKLYFADIGLSRSFNNDKIQLLHITKDLTEII